MNLAEEVQDEGPKSDLIIDAHGRNITNLDLTHNKLVSSSTDHSAKVYLLAEPNDKMFKTHTKLERTLYSKRYGHQEWVVKSKLLQDSHVVTIGMDSKVLLWHEKTVMCSDLNEMGRAHISSLTDLKVEKNNKVGFVSDQYGTVGAYNLNGTGQHAGNFTSKGSGRNPKNPKDKESPILKMNFCNSLLAGANKQGNLMLQDINKLQWLSEVSAHKGVVQKVKFVQMNNTDMLLTCGSEDGCVTLVDIHSGIQTINSGTIHTTSVNDVFQRGKNSAQFQSVEYSGVVKKFDAVANQHEEVTRVNSNVVFSKQIPEVDRLMLGCMDGSVRCQSLDEPKCLWAQGTSMQGGCASIKQQYNHIITGNDDGKICIMNF